jgi:hypothetical protein
MEQNDSRVDLAANIANANVPKLINYIHLPRYIQFLVYSYKLNENCPALHIGLFTRTAVLAAN